ncbi:MAG: hypothetical protein HRT58_14100 [Crocinitomicaceae bacterium]|nr:hypothetical protein [Flavobacteriales bacterium]NQZ36797.1 hypothetical protein [Crocinitomicaceae bacterium]
MLCIRETNVRVELLISRPPGYEYEAKSLFIRISEGYEMHLLENEHKSEQFFTLENYSEAD